MLALGLCQVLGSSARLNHDFRGGGAPQPGFVTMMAHNGAAHSPLPSRCAAIKLAPVEIRTAEFTPAGGICGRVTASTSILTTSAEPGVPTPPRQA
jgi:hypothetical protein